MSVYHHLNISPVEVSRLIEGVRTLTIPELVLLGEALAEAEPTALEVYCSLSGAPPIRIGQTRRHVAMEFPASMIRPGDYVWHATDGSNPRGRQRVVRRVELERRHVRIVTDERDDRTHFAKPVWRRVGVRRIARRRVVLTPIDGGGLGSGTRTGLLVSVGR